MRIRIPARALRLSKKKSEDFSGKNWERRTKSEACGQVHVHLETQEIAICTGRKSNNYWLEFYESKLFLSSAQTQSKEYIKAPKAS